VKEVGTDRRREDQDTLHLMLAKLVVNEEKDHPESQEKADQEDQEKDEEDQEKEEEELVKVLANSEATDESLIEDLELAEVVRTREAEVE